MSRIGNNPVKLPPKVEVTLAAGEITVKGPLGSLTRKFGQTVTIEKVSAEKDGEQLVFKALNAEASAMQGTLRALVANMVKGVTDGYQRKLTLVGVGYRAQAAGDKINLSLGFSHPVVHTMPKGIKVETPVQTEIIVKGIDKQAVGQVAAEIRAYRPPEPYKGKGVRYVDERVIIKETKKK
jgi:large subunit ribosomal protein L6